VSGERGGECVLVVQLEGYDSAGGGSNSDGGVLLKARRSRG
jgi:hypothetical protein